MANITALLAGAGESRVGSAFYRLLAERTFTPVQLIDMLITENCNFRCDYCFVHGKRPKRMSEEIVKATVDFLMLKSRHVRNVELLFLGGEPLIFGWNRTIPLAPLSRYMHSNR